MDALERHAGHFYNWYDTQSLQPLPPLYVSTVDSGNLAGHLLTLRPGLPRLADDRILRDRRWFDGPERHAARLSCDALDGTGRRRSFACSAAPETRLDVRGSDWPRAGLTARRRSRRSPLIRTAGTASAAERRRADRGVPIDARDGAPARRREIARRAASVALAKRSLPTAARLGDAPDRLLTCASARRSAQRPSRDASREPLPAERPRERARASRPDRGDRPRWRCSATSWRAWTTTSSTTRRATCWPSATTSASAGATPSYYDLLASEARLRELRRDRPGPAAAGELVRAGPPAHRPPGGEPVLLSWSGSMFEYLMPLLVMPTYENTLLDQTCRAAVRAADRVRQAARRAVGHFGVRLQHGRRRT